MDKFKKNNVINSNKENIFLILNDQGNRENNESKKIKALTYISLVKIISVFLVILKHTNENYWVFNQYWISTNIMASFCMCAVPLFSLCIGATLLDFNERYNIKIYWKRRIKKVVLPILGWNIIYYFYRVYILKNFQKINFDFINLYCKPNDAATTIQKVYRGMKGRLLRRSPFYKIRRNFRNRKHIIKRSINYSRGVYDLFGNNVYYLM